MRPSRGSKRLDYDDFCKVAQLKKEGKHLTEEGLKQIREIAAKTRSVEKEFMFHLNYDSRRLYRRTNYLFGSICLIIFTSSISRLFVQAASLGS